MPRPARREDAADAGTGTGASSPAPALEPWVVAMAAGEAGALDRLAEATLDRLYGLALRILRRVEIAEEVLQDVYLQAWRQAASFDPSRGPAIAWLVTMCRSRALDALRRMQAAERTELAAGAPDDAWAPDAPALLDAVQRRDALHEALAALEPDQRQMLGLAYFRGLSQAEIADALSLPLGTVKSRTRRALERLRAHGAVAPCGPAAR